MFLILVLFKAMDTKNLIVKLKRITVSAVFTEFFSPSYSSLEKEEDVLYGEKAMI